MKFGAGLTQSGWPPLSWFFLLAGSILFGALLAATGISRPVSSLAYDSLSKLVRPAVDDQLLIVAIDDQSISKIGRWPWNRSVHARLINQLSSAGAEAILYDVLFTEPAAPADDAQLAQAIRNGPRTALPLAFEVPGRDGKAVSVSLPIPAVMQGKAQAGHGSAAVDDDGIFRRIALRQEADGKTYRHLVPLFLGSQREDDPLIAFAPRGAIHSVPFSAVLAGEVPAEMLRNRLVLVGSTGAGLGDQYATPVSSDAALTPGVEVLANIANNMLDDRFIVDTGLVGSLTLLVVSLTLLALSFQRFDPRVSIWLVIALIMLLVVISLLALRMGKWADPAPAVIALMLIFPAWGWQRLSVANRQIGKQLALLRTDVGLLERLPQGTLRTDRVSHQLDALETGIERSIDLRRFIQSSFDSLPDPAIVVRSDGWIALANGEAHDAFRHYCGGDLPDNIGAAWTAIKPHVASDVEALYHALALPEDETLDVRLHDDRHYQVSIGHFRNAQGDNFGIIRLSDLTALRRAELQRQNALEFLSHDLRSPQSSIISLIDGHPTQIDAALGDRLRALARRTLQLAQAFVDIARVQAGSYALSEIDLRDVVQEALDALWPDLKAKSLVSKVRAPDEEVMTLVSADQLLLLRAISNLLTNAIKFAPDGSVIGVVVRARCGPDGRKGWVVMVDDRGVGVAPADRTRIFERFQSATRQSGGVGLGLSLVSAVATEFGGYARCASRPGIGSRFILWLPALAD